MAGNEAVVRTVFFISDHSGVTAETMGHSLLSQFEGLQFRSVTMPFVSSVEQAKGVVRRINTIAQEEGARPIIFCTLVDDHMRDIGALDGNQHSRRQRVAIRAGRTARHDSIPGLQIGQAEGTGPSKGLLSRFDAQ